MGFIGYRRLDDTVRMFLECADAADNAVTCTYAIDTIFTSPGDVRFEGVTDVFALKKFYKLVNSLEERAREQGRDRQVILRSPEDLLEHLRLTKNSRELPGDPARRRP
jgi:hypothetical protein